MPFAKRVFRPRFSTAIPPRNDACPKNKIRQRRNSRIGEKRAKESVSSRLSTRSWTVCPPHRSLCPPPHFEPTERGAWPIRWDIHAAHRDTKVHRSAPFCPEYSWAPADDCVPSQLARISSFGIFAFGFPSCIWTFAGRTANANRTRTKGIGGSCSSSTVSEGVK